MIDAEDLLRRFCSYVQIDTQSDEHSMLSPSTPKQWVLIRQLERELVALGIADVRVTEHGYVIATVPATTPKKNVPRVAFLAHVDTAGSCPGGAKPIVHRNYQCQPIILPDDPKQVLSVENTPLLREKIGEDIITASGMTLLGADDKAGVAAIMAAVRHLMLHRDIPHGELRICFTPDEETGHGVEHLRLDELNADAGYTIDGDKRGEINYESFSADKATVTFTGVSIHPGYAKDVMVNALRMASDFINALPGDARPEKTSGREGFIHPVEMNGTPEAARLTLLLRDFELDGLAQHRATLEALCEGIRKNYPCGDVALSVTPQYRNMRYWLERDMRPVEYARDAVQRAGVEPYFKAIRGGTDGSRLTERGLPTPNIFDGAQNVHSPREWVSLQDMVKAAETMVHLASVWDERSA